MMLRCINLMLKLTLTLIGFCRIALRLCVFATRLWTKNMILTVHSCGLLFAIFLIAIFL